MAPRIPMYGAMVLLVLALAAPALAQMDLAAGDTPGRDDGDVARPFGRIVNNTVVSGGGGSAAMESRIGAAGTTHEAGSDQSDGTRQSGICAERLTFRYRAFL